MIVNHLKELGFKIHADKSQFIPKKVVKFLGFMIDSVEMKTYLPQDKVQKMQETCELLIHGIDPSIQQVSSVVGLMNSYAKAVDYGDNHIKRLEIDKIRALKCSNGNFEEKMQISKGGKQDLIWWHNKAKTAARWFNTKSPDSTLTTDASNQGWGAIYNKSTAQGKWLEKEEGYHINEKELLAVLFGLKTVCASVNKGSVRVLSDNATTVAYINKMGGVRSPRCNKIAYEIWKTCEQRSLWLIAAHIPGVQNDLADSLSRKFSNNVEWCLNQNIFNIICNRMGHPSVDLFATRLNTKLQKFCSWKPDPDAWRIDAFSFKWKDEFFFIFPPFRLIGRVWRKIVDENSHAILIVPRWPSQPWYSMVISSARRILWFKKREANLHHLNHNLSLTTANLTNIPL